MTESSRLDPYIPRIPIFTTAGRSFLFLFVNAKAFLVCAAIPLLISEAIWYSCYFLIGGIWGIVASEFLYILPTSFFAVAWCRCALLGIERAPPRFLSRWSPRHSRIAAIQFLVLLIMIPFQWFIYFAVETDTRLGVFGLGVYLVVFFFFFTIALRMQLAQTTAAVDEPLSIQTVWDLSRQQGLRLLMAAVLVGLPIYLAQQFANELFESLTGLSSDWPALDNLGDFDRRYISISSANAVFDYLWNALVFLVLCLSFRRLTGWQPPADRSIVERFD